MIKPPTEISKRSQTRGIGMRSVIFPRNGVNNRASRWKRPFYKRRKGFHDKWLTIRLWVTRVFLILDKETDRSCLEKVVLSL